jgi:hypothetical protein
MWHWLNSIWNWLPWWGVLIGGVVLFFGVPAIVAIIATTVTTKPWLREEDEREWTGSMPTVAEIPSVFQQITGPVEVVAIGAGLSSVKVKLQGRMEFPLRIPFGTKFEPEGGGFQEMVSLRDYIVLEPLRQHRRTAADGTYYFRSEAMVEIPAACLEMHKPQPTSTCLLGVVPPVATFIRGDLRALLKLINAELTSEALGNKQVTSKASNTPVRSGFRPKSKRRHKSELPSKVDTANLSDENRLPDRESLLKGLSNPAKVRFHRVLQFAVWVVTDNPARHEFVSIMNFETSRTGPPSDHEIENIRELFIHAGIDVSKYRAFR